MATQINFDDLIPEPVASLDRPRLAPVPGYEDQPSIDLTRPLVRGKDDEVHTEYTTTKRLKGKWAVIPQVVGGRMRSDREAYRLADRGENPPVGLFDSQSDADKYAQARTKAIDDLRGDEIRSFRTGGVTFDDLLPEASKPQRTSRKPKGAAVGFDDLIPSGETPDAPAVTFDDLLPGSTAAAPETVGGPEFLRGIRAGGYQTLSALTGAYESVLRTVQPVLDKIGLGEWTEQAADYYDRQWQAWTKQARKEHLSAKSPNTANIEDLKSFGEWLAYNTGSGGTQMAGAVVSALAGGTPGLLTYALTFGTGEAASEIKHEGVKLSDRVKLPGGLSMNAGQLAMVAGVPIGLIEMLGGPERFMRQIFSQSRNRVVGSVLKRIGFEAARSGGIEAGEEYLQNWVSSGAAAVAADKPLDLAEVHRQGLEEAAAVIPAAAAFGGGAGGAMSLQDRAAEQGRLARDRQVEEAEIAQEAAARMAPDQAQVRVEPTTAPATPAAPAAPTELAGEAEAVTTAPVEVGATAPSKPDEGLRLIMGGYLPTDRPTSNDLREWTAYQREARAAHDKAVEDGASTYLIAALRSEGDVAAAKLREFAVSQQTEHTIGSIPPRERLLGKLNVVSGDPEVAKVFRKNKDHPLVPQLKRLIKLYEKEGDSVIEQLSDEDVELAIQAFQIMTHAIDAKVGFEGLGATDRQARALAAEMLRKQGQAERPAQEKRKALPPPGLPSDIPRTIYRGYGRKDKAEVYNVSGTAIPILGEGSYYAFSEEDAKKFGPSVESREVDFDNPLVIRDGEEWRELTRNVGWPVPNLYGLPEAEVQRHIDDLNNRIKGGGHDAVVVWWDDTSSYDIDPEGRNIKLLRNVFGEPQIYVPATRKAASPKKSVTKRKPPSSTIEFPPELPPGAPSGTLPKRAQSARSQAALENALDEADARRNREELSPELRQEAAKFQADAVRELARIEADLLDSEIGQEYTAAYNQGLAIHKTDGKASAYANGYVAAILGQPRIEPEINAKPHKDGYESGEAHVKDRARAYGEKGPKFYEARPVEFTLRTARGREARFSLNPNPGAVRALREQLEKKTAVGKFAMAAPVASRGRGPGAQYRGMRQEPAYDPRGPETSEEALGQDAKRREAILADLMRALGVPLYQGRIKGKAKAGHFRRRLEEVRIKRKADLEVAAHETAHLLDERIPEIRRQWHPARKANKTVRDELAGVSYDQKKIFEGFAEFVRLWATQPEQAQRAAPTFYAWWEDFLDRNEYGPAIRRTKQAMLEWFEQDALKRAQSKIGEAEDINAFMGGSIGQRFRQAALDDLYGIANAEKTLFGEVASGGPYETARLTRGVGAVVISAVRYGAPVRHSSGRIVFVDQKGEPATTFTTKGGLRRNPSYERWGLQAILAPVRSNLQAFGAYAVGRRAQFLRSQGRENLFTPQEIEALLDLETPARKKAFENWNRFNSQILDFAQQSGVIDPIKRKDWETNVYLPFWRADHKAAGRARSHRGDAKLIYRLKGGTGNLRDPIVNMFQNTRMLIEAAVVNDARRQTIKDILGAQGGGRFLSPVPRETVPVRVPFEMVRDRMLAVLEEAARQEGLSGEESGKLNVTAQIIMDKIGEDFARFWLTGMPPQGSTLQAYMENGRAVYVEVADPLLLRALEALPRRIVRNVVLDFMRGVRRLGQATITLSPDFMIRNIVRDNTMAGVMTRAGYRPFIDAAVGFKHRLVRDATYKEWLAQGGSMASLWHDEAAIHAGLDDFYRKRGIAYETVINTPRKAIRFLEMFGNHFEEATRLGEFDRALRKGMTPRHAAFLSREVSTDFAMRGDNYLLGLMYDTFIFFKAGVVGMDRVYRGFAMDTPKARAQTALRTGLISLLTVGLWAMNRGNPLYDDLQDWDRDTHWHFYPPRPGRLEEWIYFQINRKLPRRPEGFEDLSDLEWARKIFLHFRLPTPWEIGGVAKITERAVEAAITGGNGEEAAKRSAKIVWDMFRTPMFPQVVEPVMEMVFNYDPFFDRDIESQSMREQQKWARYGPYTSQAVKRTGDLIRGLPPALQIVSPIQIEHLLRGYFGTLAGNGLLLVDQVFFDDIPDVPLWRVPGIGVVYRDNPGSTKYIQKFYDMVKEARQARRTMREMFRQYRPDVAENIADSEANLEYRMLNGVAEAMGIAHRNMRIVADMPTLEAVQEYARDQLGRASVFGPKIKRVEASDRVWNDIGALKADLIDMWRMHAANLAKQAVQRVEAQREKRKTLEPVE